MSRCDFDWHWMLATLLVKRIRNRGEGGTLRPVRDIPTSRGGGASELVRGDRGPHPRGSRCHRRSSLDAAYRSVSRAECRMPGIKVRAPASAKGRPTASPVGTLGRQNPETVAAGETM